MAASNSCCLPVASVLCRDARLQELFGLHFPDGWLPPGASPGARADMGSDIGAPLVAVTAAISMDFACIFYPLQDMIYLSRP